MIKEIILCFALLTCFIFNVNAKEHIYGDTIVSSVTSIYDGDTFRVNIPSWPSIIGHHIPIRLNGADTPEMRAKCTYEKQMAHKAKQYTVHALRSAKHIELRNMKRGKYFRIVADVYVDGKSLAKGLLKAGLAYPYGGGHKRSWCAKK